MHSRRRPPPVPNPADRAAYNHTMRAVTFALLLACSAAPALSQNNAKNGTSGTTDGREKLSNSEQKSDHLNQRTERIRVEDGGSRVDELRVGGQTQSITVQPKVGTLPEYEVQPSDGVRNRSRNGSESTTGARVWNVMKF